MSYAQVPSHHSPPIKPIKRPHSNEGDTDRPHITPTAPTTTTAGTATPTALPEKDEGADNVADFDDEASKLLKQLQSSSSSYRDPPSLSSPLQHQDDQTPTSVLDKIAPANERVEQRHENIRNIYDIEPTTPVKESTSTLASPTLQGQGGDHIYDFNHEAANLLKAIAVSSPSTATAHAASIVPGAVEGTDEDEEKVDTKEEQVLDKVADPTIEYTTIEPTKATNDAHDDDGDDAVIETDTATTAAATSEAIGDDDGAEASPDPTTTATSPSKGPKKEKRNKNNKNKK